MPKPIFDINEYELRGVTPPVFSEAQKKRLNDVLSRANGQIDWTAQLLGFNGPNYWGLPSPKADGSYDWKGLPNTMNQKRQLQTTTFGVYDKDKEYSTRPAPFNRSEIKASGDASFHIWESNGRTNISPLGQGELITFGSPDVFVDGEYVFDNQVEFIVEGDESDTLRWAFFNGENQEWTRMLLKQQSGLIRVRIRDSQAEPAFLRTRVWQDISDWKSTEVANQFIGLWGNKGNALSFDAAFDALELHGFSEQEALGFRDTKTCLTPADLLAKVGLKATTWTKYWNTKFGLQVGNCPIVYPLPAEEVEDNFTFYTCDDCNTTVELSQTQTVVIDPENRLFNNREYDESLPPAICLISNGFFDEGDVSTCEPADEGEYDRLLEDAVPCTGNDSTVKGIKELCITYTPKTDCAYVDFPCIEFVFDPELNDGLYPKDSYCPATPGPWMTADDGEYDEISTCFDGASQTVLRCEDATFCGFDDGFYNKRVEPNCVDPTVEQCGTVNGGYDTINGPPNYLDDCDCYVDCCLVNNAQYIYGDAPYLGPSVEDGGIYGTEGCVIYDNSDYDRDPTVFECTLDDGLIEGPPSTETVDSGFFNRFLPDCVECEDPGPPDPVDPCPQPPIRVNLKEAFEDLAYVMRPDVGNSLTPLRLWKNRVLTVTDEVPADGTERYNFLVADENRGPEPTDDYRYFVRLPIEYPRNGPQWNKAEAVCNNQSYFSAPSNLSQTQNDPPVLRPVLFDEEYFNPDLPVSTVFYNESFLVSTVRIEEQGIVQSGFEDSSISSEPVQNTAFEQSSVVDYDAFEQRIPYPDGDWRGEYYDFGTNENLLSSFISNNTDDQRLQLVGESEEPVYDMSRIKLPNIEFPNSVDQAALKDYVVSYAYFVADYSASDDPVFDPGNEICWRSETLACEKLDDSGNCISNPLPSRTAYLLHPTTTTTNGNTTTQEAIAQTRQSVRQTPVSSVTGHF